MLYHNMFYFNSRKLCSYKYVDCLLLKNNSWNNCMYTWLYDHFIIMYLLTIRIKNLSNRSNWIRCRFYKISWIIWWGFSSFFPYGILDECIKNYLWLIHFCNRGFNINHYSISYFYRRKELRNFKIFSIRRNKKLKLRRLIYLRWWWLISIRINI